jgi:phosphatidylglycerol:prolipoprotein diacylglycerol transferase
MPGPFVHRIDPVIADLGGVYLWWYGLSYALGFLGIHLWFRRARNRLGMSVTEVYSISLHLTIGVLLGGRLIEVICYEWNYYSNHLLQIPACWLGGMATHGLLLGATLGTLLFCRQYGRSFLAITDDLVIPGAWIMGVGRLGNFIDGQISGAVTDVWWAVQFPDIEGFRHPVVLYDGLKNLLLIPFLLWIRQKYPHRGVVFAHFVFWYAFLRIFVDLFREYRVETLGLGTGQIINIAMSILGLALLIWFHQRRLPLAQVGHSVTRPTGPARQGTLWAQRLFFGLLLLFCLTIPSDWTQDIPERYGKRHPGLRYSLLYPRIEEIVPVSETNNHRMMPNQGNH